ncbi:hypothetical protein [Thermus scotoductus]|uniref:hypothetical protein n=1 Tax=Thermus scotoductus TaxID=37636 RepID=UPI00242D2C54|nr:hypothetical protein [Thermus scotoductus]
MRWLLVLGIFLSLALAGPCGGRPYTLETEEGLLGGQEMSYDGEVLVFEGQACLEREGLYLEASTIRYLEAEGTFQGEELQGEIEGWRLRAKALEGKELKGVVLERGRLRVEAERVGLEAPTQALGVLLTAPAYRVRAEEATLTREEAKLKGLLATPCPCGEDLRLRMEEATFLVATGELKGEATLGLWGLEVPLGEATANANRRPELSSPLVLGGTDSGGWSVGLQDFPLPRPGEEIGRWGRRITLLATGLGVGQEALRLGFREDEMRVALQLGYAPGASAWAGDLFLGFSPDPPDADTPRLEARYTPSLRLENLTLKPFLRYAETARSQGPSLGLEGSYRYAHQEGPFALSLKPEALFALYPFTGYGPYLALAGGVELAYREGDLALRAAYGGRLEPLTPTPPFTWENRDEFQRLQLEGVLGPWGLGYTLENPLGQRLDRLEGRYQDSTLGAFRLAYVRGSLEEVRLAYAMPQPERACCQALWLAPEVGLNREGLTRMGLTLRYYDGCFAYEVRWQNTLKGQYSEATGQSLSFGLALR